MSAVSDLTPRLMRASTAARYIGVSEGTLRGLAIPRKTAGSMKFYDRADLDVFADALPYEDEGENSCDEAFGIEA